MKRKISTLLMGLILSITAGSSAAYAQANQPPQMDCSPYTAGSLVEQQCSQINTEQSLIFSLNSELAALGPASSASPTNAAGIAMVNQQLAEASSRLAALQAAWQSAPGQVTVNPQSARSGTVLSASSQASMLSQARTQLSTIESQMASLTPASPTYTATKTALANCECNIGILLLPTLTSDEVSALGQYTCANSSSYSSCPVPPCSITGGSPAC